MAYSSKSYFPSQAVSDAEKLSYDYGLKIAKAIETEWFSNDVNNSRYRNNYNNFHNLRSVSYTHLTLPTTPYV